MTVEAMVVHVRALAVIHRVVIEWRRYGARGRAWPRKRTVAIPEIRGGAGYALALHEFGHIVGKKPKGRLPKERAAWEWAQGVACAWSPAMERKYRGCIGSYERWAARRAARGLPVVR